MPAFFVGVRVISKGTSPRRRTFKQTVNVLAGQMARIEKESVEVAKEIVLRAATTDDRDAIARVESLATPRLSYLPHVFESFVSDTEGEFSVAEADGEVVACGKFSVLPDGSAWLESIRVVPDHQGIGIGKLFYRRFFELAEQKGIDTMRMYTGVTNAASRGLAERFGFRHVGTYRGCRLPLQDVWIPATGSGMVAVSDGDTAVKLLEPLGEKWEGFLVMNRTFYAATPTLYSTWAREGKVYFHQKTGSVAVVGARFMPEVSLHIACADGDPGTWLHLALQKATELGVQRVECMFPPKDRELEEFLSERGFRLDDSDCIVMETNL